MSTPFLGEIRIASMGFAPTGWALCNGQLMAINQNQALFSILGTTYGGNGVTTFALPNLQGRVPLNAGGTHTLGEVGGEENHTLTSAEMPSHTHVPRAAADATTAEPVGARWGTTAQPHYGPTAQVAQATAAIGTTGANQAHPNQPPYLVLTFMIALVGIFPSRN